MANRIMVVEDEPILVELLQEFLTFEGYEVLLPQSQDSVLADLRNEHPQSLLMDVNLDGASGLDLLDQIRADDDLKDIFVVLSSGMDYERESKKRGADVFLMKPYMPDDLVRLLPAETA